MTSSSRRLWLMTVKRSGALGCVWLAVIPFLLFVLCQLHHTQLVPRQPSSPPLPSSVDFLMSRLYSNFTTNHTPTLEASSPPSRLNDLERKVTEDYIRVRLALAASSGRLQTAGKGFSLTNLDTLQDLSTLQPLLTPREKARLLYLLEVFTHACRTNSLPFFLLGDSLLGAVRHHGLIPWRDVSVTVGMNKDQQKGVREVLEGVEGVTLMWPNPYSWSLRLWDALPDPPSFSRMTYILIQFYQQNSSHVWADSWNRRLFTADVRRVFPLGLRPFEGQMMPVPCDFESVLDPRGVQQCRVAVEDPLEGKFLEAGHVPCDVLSPVFPFVTRRLAMTSQSILEQVTVNKTLLYTSLVDGICSSQFP